MADKTVNKSKGIIADTDYSFTNNTEKSEADIHTTEERKRINAKEVSTPMRIFKAVETDDNNIEKRLYITMLNKCKF